MLLALLQSLLPVQALQTIATPSKLAGERLIKLLDNTAARRDAQPAVLPTIGAKDWANIATLLRDAACDFAEESVVFGESNEQQDAQRHHHMAAIQTCESLLDMTRSAVPELHAIAKLSAKRNGRLSSSRAAERCLAELGLLIGTFAALEAGDERAALLDAVRPVSQHTPTAARLRSLLVLCRGFHSPGFGSSHGWRKGKGTVHQLALSHQYTADTKICMIHVEVHVLQSLHL